MRRVTLIKATSVMFVAVLAFGALPARALPSHTPTSFGYLATDVLEGDTIDITCTGDLPRISTTAQTFTKDGELVQGGWGFTNNGSSAFVDLKYGEQGMTVATEDQDLQGGFVGAGSGSETAPTAGRYRMAWASWGGDPLACSAKLNGSPIATHAGTSATYLLSSDFTRGVGVSTSSIGVASHLELDQTVNGYVFTYLPTFPGSGTATDPDGFVYASPLGVAIASEKDGAWKYTLDAAIRSGGVWGVTMIIPD